MQRYFRPGIPTFHRSTMQLGALSVVTTLLAVSVASVTLAYPSIESTPALSSVDWVAQSQQAIAYTGTFVAAEAPTTGTAQIVTVDGHRYLEIDSAFSTTNQAPDLHVLLETAAVPPSSYTTFGSYINLGKLQTVTGAQRYPIPDSVDVSQFQSIVIWCRMANATIGYAPLVASSSNAQL